MSQVIMEDDIFKYLVEHEDVEMNVMQNIKGFLTEIPINIFKDEYYILYKAIQIGETYNIPITIDHVEQLLISNLDDILKDPKVTLYKDGDKKYTENERANLIQQQVSSTFQMLEDYEVEDENAFNRMRFNIKLYVGEWAKEEYSKTLIAMDTILREGRKYNNRLYKGVEDANTYYVKKFDLIQSLLEGEVDRLSDVISTLTDTTQEIKEKLKEDSYEVIARTGVEDWDENYSLARGEMVVIQGGSGAGKTRSGVNICHEAVTTFKKNVLVLSLEQKSSRIMPMFIAKHSTRLGSSEAEWLNDKAIIQRTLNEHQKMLRDIVLDDLTTNEEYGKIQIEGINLHANSVRSYLEKVWDSGFHFDVVLLDYIGILDTSGEDRYHALTEVVNELKAECKTFKGQGFLAVLPNQLTNKAEEALKKGDYELSSTGGSETAYLRRGADYVYTIIQTDEMKIANKMKWLVEKVRLGEPVESKIDILSYQGQCLYLSDSIEEVEAEEELI